MEFEDLPRIVEVQLRSFPGFFLSFLGPRFLRLLYQSMREDAGGVVLVACQGGRVQGFVAGVLRQTGFYRRAVRGRMCAFAMASLRPVLRRPSAAMRLIRALRTSGGDAKAAQACLMSIAVDPESTGTGIGKRLVMAFCVEMRQRGAPAVCLTTDRDANASVNRFYQTIGFRISRTFITPEGRAMNEYVISLCEHPGEYYAR